MALEHQQDVHSDHAHKHLSAPIRTALVRTVKVHAPVVNMYGDHDRQELHRGVGGV